MFLCKFIASFIAVGFLSNLPIVSCQQTYACPGLAQNPVVVTGKKMCIEIYTVVLIDSLVYLSSQLGVLFVGRRIFTHEDFFNPFNGYIKRDLLLHSLAK